MATAVTCRPSCRASQSMAPLTTVPVEPPNRKPRPASWGQAPAGGRPPAWATPAAPRRGGAAGREAAAAQLVAGPEGVRLLDEDHLVDEGLIEQFRADAATQAGDHPSGGRAAERHRADGAGSAAPHR